MLPHRKRYRKLWYQGSGKCRIDQTSQLNLLDHLRGYTRGHKVKARIVFQLSFRRSHLVTYFWNSHSLLSRGQTWRVFNHREMQWKWKACCGKMDKAIIANSVLMKRYMQNHKIVCKSRYLSQWIWKSCEANRGEKSGFKPTGFVMTNVELTVTLTTWIEPNMYHHAWTNLELTLANLRPTLTILVPILNQWFTLKVSHGDQ